MKVDGGLLGAGLGLAALGVALYSHYKTAKALEKMGVSFAGLEQKTSYEISPDIMNAAAKEVATRELEKASKTLLDDAKATMQRDIHKAALNAVTEASESSREAAKEAYLEGVKKDAERTYVQATTPSGNPDFSKAFDGMTGYQKMEALKAFANAIGGIAKPSGY